MSLDDDLAAWAATVRLPDADAAAIFRRIIASPAGPAPAPRGRTGPPTPRAQAVLVARLQRRLRGADGGQHRAGPARRLRAAPPEARAA